MHICMVLATNRPFPPDIRVEKELSILSKQGFNISILTNKIPEEAPQHERLYDGKVNLFRVHIKKQNIIQDFWSRLFFQYAEWQKTLDIFIQKEKPDCLHVHDLRLVPTAVSVAQKYNIKVIADLHENLPAAERAYRTGYSFFKRFIFCICSNYYLMRYYEAKALKKCEKIIVVVPEAAERLYRYGIPSDKITIVSNTEDESTFNFNIVEDATIEVNNYKNFWIASYVGGIGPHRGIDTVLNAIPYIGNKIHNFLFLIVGVNKKQSKTIQNNIKN